MKADLSHGTGKDFVDLGRRVLLFSLGSLETAQLRHVTLSILEGIALRFLKNFRNRPLEAWNRQGFFYFGRRWFAFSSRNLETFRLRHGTGLILFISEGVGCRFLKDLRKNAH